MKNLFKRIIDRIKKKREREEKEFEILAKEKQDRFREETLNVDLTRLENDFNF